MIIRNSIIDQLEHEEDKFTYALNIGLKSGEIVYLDGINLGEKNAYLNFAKYSKETMLLEIDSALYRISASDIESISVKKYSTGSAKLTGLLGYLFLSKGRFNKNTYIVWIKWFVVASIFAMIYAGVKYVLSEDLVTVLMDKSTFSNIITMSIEYIKKLFPIFLGIQGVLFLIDLILPPKEKYQRLKPYPSYAEPAKLSNLIVIIIFAIMYAGFLYAIGKYFA